MQYPVGNGGKFQSSVESGLRTFSGQTDFFAKAKRLRKLSETLLMSFGLKKTCKNILQILTVSAFLK